MPDTLETIDDERRPISAATRVFLGLLISLLVVVLVIGVILVRTLVPTVQSDSAVASERLGSFLSIDLPDDFIPVATLDWNLLYVIPMSGVWIEADAGDSVVSIVRLEGRMKSDPAVRERAIEALRDQSIGSGTIEKTEPFECIVNGKQRELTVLLVRDSSGNRARVLGADVVVGGEQLLIEIKRPELEFNVAEVKSWLESIGPPRR